MRFEILNSKQIDPTQWDHLVLGSANPSLYQTFDYLNLCEGDWEALVGFEEDRYQCAMVFPFRKKGWMKYIYQSPAIPYLVPVNSSYNEEFENQWKTHLKKHSYVAKYFVRMDLVGGFELYLTQHEALELNLRDTYENLASRYSRSRRTRLQQSKSNGQVVNSSDDLDLFIANFETHTLSKIEGMNKIQQQRINRQWKKLKENGHAEVYFSSVGNEVVSGILLGKYATTLYYLASFATPKGRELNGMTLLIDFVIHKYAHGSCQTMDMGPAGVPTITEFKRDFGSTPYTVSQVYWNSLPWFIRVPKSILNRLGIAVGKT